MIEVDSLSLAFGSKELLKDISFTLGDRRHLAIMGESGSGKSLLAKSLLRLNDENFIEGANTLKIDGIDVLGLEGKSLRALRQYVYLIYQNSYLSFHPLITIGGSFSIILRAQLGGARLGLENSLAHFYDGSRLSRAEVYERIAMSLDLVGLNVKDIYHAYVNELSEGTLQRVQIAIALASSASYLICDEITTNIDAEHRALLLDLLGRLKERLSLIIITHEKDFASALCDSLIEIENGEVINASL